MGRCVKREAPGSARKCATPARSGRAGWPSLALRAGKVGSAWKAPRLGSLFLRQFHQQQIVVAQHQQFAAVGVDEVLAHAAAGERVFLELDALIAEDNELAAEVL